LDPPTEGSAKGQARTDPGSRVLGFDFPSFKVGMAEYEEGPTGCTVFHFPEGAATAFDVRGGNVGKIGQDESALGLVELGMVTSEAAWDAVLSS
jgi:L-aminopeptidase/D-esterase-like protein